MMHFALTPSDRARSVRAELEVIAASLNADELARLVLLGRRILDASEAASHDDGGEG